MSTEAKFLFATYVVVLLILGWESLISIWKNIAKSYRKIK